MAELNREQLLEAYRLMKTIREFEERLHVEIATGQIAGFTHLYAGQEAVAVGVCMHMDDRDYIASTHRGHGHCIAKGCDVIGMMKEIYGAADGLCKGKGGSMHIADLDKGMLGANAIVGGGPPLAVGAAIATKLRGEGKITAAFGGDGSSNQGTVFEAMNLAVVLQLPTIFVFEDNGYAEHTGTSYAVGAEDIATRSAGFGMPAAKVDGTDFFAVYAAMAEATKRAREGGGPTTLECTTSRYYGHYEGDPQKYRAANEVAELRAARDCLTRFRQDVVSAGRVESGELDAIDTDVAKLIDQAVAAAQAAPRPSAADVLSDVYISYQEAP